MGVRNLRILSSSWSALCSTATDFRFHSCGKHPLHLVPHELQHSNPLPVPFLRQHPLHHLMTGSWLNPSRWTFLGIVLQILARVRTEKVFA